MKHLNLLAGFILLAVFISCDTEKEKQNALLPLAALIVSDTSNPAQAGVSLKEGNITIDGSTQTSFAKQSAFTYRIEPSSDRQVPPAKKEISIMGVETALGDFALVPFNVNGGIENGQILFINKNDEKFSGECQSESRKTSADVLNVRVADCKLKNINVNGNTGGVSFRSSFEFSGSPTVQKVTEAVPEKTAAPAVGYRAANPDLCSYGKLANLRAARNSGNTVTVVESI